MQIERIARMALAGLSVVLSVASASGARAACGDGVLEAPTELCDDGNVLLGDGCNGTCQTEAGYVCTGAPSLCCFAEAASGFALQGAASLDRDTGEVTLVPDENRRTGVVWFRRRLDFTNPFTIDLRIYLGTRDEAPMSNAVDMGADGGSLLFQRDPRGLGAIGAFGAELGAQGIGPVFGVEFDTYYNGLPYNDETNGDEDHISVFHTRTTPQSNHLTDDPVCLNDDTVCANYEDGKYHRFAVEWTGNTTRQLKVYVDGVIRVDLTHDFIGEYFAGDPKDIYFGFAASTGDSRNLHKFCPAAPIGFTVPRDRDEDDVDDGVDLDDDKDGRSDADETNNVFGSDDPSEDHDRDGVPNYRDPQYWTTVLSRPNDCPDVVAPIGACDRLPVTVDFDGDAIPDHLDHDSDADTLTDAREDYNADTNGDGYFDACTPVNADGTCPGTRPTVLPDADADGAIDSRDNDSDNDGSSDQSDPARDDPCVPNTDAVVCATGDADQDGLTNGVECPNPRQCPDSNGDGTPDYQDPDQDKDGVFDGVDPAPRDPCIPNATLLVCGSGDSDGDGAPNQTDPAPLDPCIPNPNTIACPTGDRDSDGLANGFECPGGMNCVDTDGDGRPDVDDTDSDGDGIDDGEECESPPACADGDGDGVPDWRDPNPEIAGGACRAVPHARFDNLGGLVLVALALLSRRRRRVGLSAASRARTSSSERSG